MADDTNVTIHSVVARPLTYDELDDNFSELINIIQEFNADFATASLGRIALELDTTDDVTFADIIGAAGTFSSLNVTGTTNLGPALEITLSGGVATATQTRHLLDTESNDPTDDCDTINGSVDGALLIITIPDAGRISTLKDGTGNLNLNGDYVPTSVNDQIFLVGDGTDWNEIGRSING